MEENKLENLEEIKNKNQYEHPILLESFINIEEPVMDSDGNIRSKNEKELKKGILSRKPVTIIESADLRKVQNDYKTINDRFDDLEKMFSMMMLKLDKRIDEQQQEIKKLTERLDVSEAKNQILTLENQALKNIQKPSLRLMHEPNKRRKLSQIDESDNENSAHDSDLEIIPLSPRESLGRRWNPITGMRDTFSVFTPRSVLLQEKQENALRRASFGNEMSRVKRLINDNPTIVNGRGMPDSICSLVRSFNDKTPLMLAAQQGNLECVKTLIESGAALDLLDRDNFTALDYAQQNQHRDVSVFLMRQKAHNGVDVVEKEDISDKMKLN